jgi:hypothetical protein
VRTLFVVVLACLGLSMLACSPSDTSDEVQQGDAQEAIAGGRDCTDDSECNHGVAGLGVICVRENGHGHCEDGCKKDDDCPGGGSCNTTTKYWTCDDPLPRIGTACDDDKFCTGVDTEGADNYDDTESLAGVGRVCSTRSKRCIVGCHHDQDCPSGARCDTKRTTPVCVAQNATGNDGNDGDDGDPPPDEPETKGCPVITYPSGATLQTVLDPDMTAKYVALHASSCLVPKCFIDLSDLRSKDGTAQDLDLQLSEHFTLREIVATELSGHFSNKVVVDSSFVTNLEKLRQSAGTAVTLNSAFRSPDHQQSTCHSLCGCDQCVSDGHGGNRCGNAGGRVTCAKNSRHMWGAAADMSLNFASAARNAGFPFVFEEFGGSGPHLHIDMKACR